MEASSVTRVGNWGVSDSTPFRVFLPFPEKNGDSRRFFRFQEGRTEMLIHAFARYSDILRENYLPGLGSPVSNLSHLRTSCSHIIHQIPENCNTFLIFFSMNFSTFESLVLYHMHKIHFFAVFHHPFRSFRFADRPPPIELRRGALRASAGVQKAPAIFKFNGEWHQTRNRQEKSKFA